MQPPGLRMEWDTLTVPRVDNRTSLGNLPRCNRPLSWSANCNIIKLLCKCLHGNLRVASEPQKMDRTWKWMFRDEVKQIPKALVRATKFTVIQCHDLRMSLIRIYSWKPLLHVLYRLKRSFGQGNISTSVCQEFCPWGGYLTRHPDTPSDQAGTPLDQAGTPRTRLLRDQAGTPTPRTRHPPDQRPDIPRTRHPPGPDPLDQAGTPPS